MRRIAVFALRTVFLVALLGSRASAQGPLIWEDQFDLAGSADFAQGVTVSGDRAVAIGVGTTADKGTALLVRAYDVRNGALQWQDQAPLASGIITKVVIDEAGQKVFGAGYAASFPGTDFLVRAYDVRTGRRLWEDVVDKGRDDFVQGIAAGRHAVVVVGYGGNSGGETVKFLVRAHNKRTGALLWEDQIGDGKNDAAAWRVETRGGVVFVAGTIATNSSRDLVIRAYDELTGALVWESRYPDALVGALAAGPNRLYVGGNALRAGKYDSLLAAYDLETGNLEWLNLATGGFIRDLVPRGARLFAIGAGTSLVSAYQNETGSLIWEDHPVINPDGHYDLLNAIDVGSGQLLAAGTSGVDFQYQESLVRSYSLITGELLWEDRSHRGWSSGASDIAVARGHAFAVGWSTSSSAITDTDFIVRAYSAVRNRRVRTQGIQKDSEDDGDEAER